MRKTHIIGLVMIALCIGVLISVMGGTSSYADFSTAVEEPNKDHHVVGIWVKEKGIVYNPAKDPNYFSFYMQDSTGTQKQVVYRNNKPADFEKSERVVVVGRMNNGVLEASQILMKCPSKYNEGTVKVQGTAKQ
jgi:cytochrome c-type biogenesis protein CcmE